MKKLFVCLALMAQLGLAGAQCNPIGWVLVNQKLISVTERVCVYAKNGATVTIMVSGLCPLSPC
mgnify:CR=1 FL=1